jgi:hypothetical protein
MRKIFFLLFCVICTQTRVSAQKIIPLETESINGLTVIMPVFSNLFKLEAASRADFLATVKSLNYTQRTPTDTNIYHASSNGHVYDITKDEKTIDFFFEQGADYFTKLRDKFFVQYPNATFKVMDNGTKIYFFSATNELSETTKYCIVFDLPANGSAGVTLVRRN